MTAQDNDDSTTTTEPSTSTTEPPTTTTIVEATTSTTEPSTTSTTTSTSSSTETTSTSATTSSITTSTAAVTTSTSVTVTSTTVRACDPAPCNDGDHCTNDGCVAAGCTNTELAPTEPAGVLCSVENARTILNAGPRPLCPRRCPNTLQKRLDSIAELILEGAAGGPGRCRRKLHAARRVARELDRRVSRLNARGVLTSPALTVETVRLRVRAETLARNFCPLP